MKIDAFDIFERASGDALFRSQTFLNFQIWRVFFFLFQKKYFDNSLVILAVRSPTQLPEAIQSNFATL